MAIKNVLSEHDNGTDWTWNFRTKLRKLKIACFMKPLLRYRVKCLFQETQQAFVFVYQ